ncbi:MAG: DegT/DnrJ/EryC1/StrS family aminotransferase [Geminocystis sp.]|nr:DegT/DnrJ/EryC1/StrS family aminotransferase [Geminocystis sp.]
MIKKIIPFHKPHITEEEINEVVDSIKSGWLTMGPKTIEFEKQFKDYIFATSETPEEKRFAISVNSCTAALHLALKAIGIRPGDEVIIPTNTFIATAEVVTYFGAKPVLCDIEEDTHNIDVSKIESLITPKTRAIIPVHFAGQPCDMDEILEIAEKYNLKVVEDAAHALPSKYKGKMIGTIGHITCFSFYATKTLATGEGGMATTTNEVYARIIKINRLHGIDRDAWDRYTLKGSWYYEVVDGGYKYNTTDINSALGLAQLRKIDWMRERRAQIAQQYNRAFCNTSYITPLRIKTDRDTSWHLYVIKVNNRDELMENLRQEGIGVSVHFIPVHMHSYYRAKYGYKNEDYPVANKVFQMSLSLPIYPQMKQEEVDYVIEKVLKYAR